MPGPRMLHAADLHLGAPLASLGAHVGHTRAAHLRSLAAGAFDQLVRVAIEAEVQLVVLGGDVYDDAHREVAAQVRFARALGRLHEAGIPVFIAHGNHDPVATSYRPAAALPPSVTVFEPGPVQVHEVGLTDGTSVAVAGVSFSTPHERDNLARRFHDLHTGDRRCVAVLHANLEGTVGHDPYAPCTLDDLSAAPVTYWALGHVHLRSGGRLNTGIDGSRRWAYPGNLQGRSAKPSECGAKGALMVPLTPDGVGEPEFVACDRLRFERLDIDVSAATDVADALQLLDTEAAQLAASSGDRPVLLRARLVGSTPAHEHLLGARDQLLELARESHHNAMGDGALLRVDLATRAMVERSRLIDRGDLLAELLRATDRLRADGDQAIGDELSRCADAVLDAGTRHLLDEMRVLDPGLARRVLDGVEQRFVDELAAWT